MREKFIPALGFSFLTPFYDLICKATMPSNFRAKFISQIEPKGKERILDFGSGSGENAILIKLSNKDVDIIGIEIDSQIREIALKKCSKRGVNVRFLLYGGDILPFQNEYFDKVICSLVFCNLRESQKLHYLEEIYRVVKKSGSIYILDWDYRRGKINGRIMNHLLKLTPFKYTSNNREQLTNLIEHVGFKNQNKYLYIETMTGTLYSFHIKK